MSSARAPCDRGDNEISSLYSDRAAHQGPATKGEGEMTPTNDEMAQVLRPVAPPRVLEGVYTDDQYERIVGMLKAKGPVADDHRSPLRYGRGARGHDLGPDPRRRVGEAHARRHRDRPLPRLPRPRARRASTRSWRTASTAPSSSSWSVTTGGRSSPSPRTCCSTSAVPTTAASARTSMPSSSGASASRTRRCGCRT